jgi:hypothetical protein
MSPTEVVSESPLVEIPFDLNVEQLLEYRRGQARRREYEPIGILEKVQLEASAVANTSPDNPLMYRKDLSASLDWMKTGPLVARTRDTLDFLIIGQMPHPPDLPDPSWRPEFPPKRHIGGIPVPEDPPLIRQSLTDRCTGCFVERRRRGSGMLNRIRTWWAPDEASWFVFQPVTQILLLLADRTGMGVIACGADLHGRHTALLYNAKEQEGHILFGEKRLEFYRI